MNSNVSGHHELDLEAFDLEDLGDISTEPIKEDSDENGKIDIDKYLKRREEIETAIGPAFISASLKYLSGSEQLKNAVNESLEYVGLLERKQEFAKNFSGGMKRRLNIACALGHNPELLIFDEPTVGIDPQSRNFILDKIKESNAKGATVIYTSHYMEEVEAICTRIAIMDNGKIIACGTSQELKKLVNSGDENITLEEVFLTLTGKKLRDYAE